MSLTLAIYLTPSNAASKSQAERVEKTSAAKEFVKSIRKAIFNEAAQDAALPGGPYRNQCTDIKLSPGGERLSALCAGRRVNVDNVSACAILSFEGGRLICRAVKLPQGRGQYEIRHRPVALPRGPEEMNFSRHIATRLARASGAAGDIPLKPQLAAEPPMVQLKELA